MRYIRGYTTGKLPYPSGFEKRIRQSHQFGIELFADVSHAPFANLRKQVDAQIGKDTLKHENDQQPKGNLIDIVQPPARLSCGSINQFSGNVGEN